MELERMNPEGAPEAPEEEKRDEGRSCCACIDCDSFHETVSKWMLPEDTRGTYLERANCIPPPIFILAISVAELTTFVYYAVSKPQEQWITLGSGIWDSPFIYRPDKRKEAWRFLSYMLVHAGIEHILGNLFLQLILGIPLELVHKGHRVGLVYIAGVIAGSLASSVCDPLYALVGASGGVYALIGGYFMNVLVNFREMIPLFGFARLLFIFLIVGTDIGFALYRRFSSPANEPLSREFLFLLFAKMFMVAWIPIHGTFRWEWAQNRVAALKSLRHVFWQVSFVAHIAGGLSGMSIGYVIFSSFDHNFIKDPRFWVSIIAYLVFVGFAIFFNVFFSPANG